MKVLTFSTKFPKGHPKAGEPTCFVEKVWNSFNVKAMGETFLWPGEEYTSDYEFNKNLPYGVLNDFLDTLTRRDDIIAKGHTIRVGNRFKVGDMASLRIWSGAPYRSKQVEFAQVEVKKVWAFIVHEVGGNLYWKIEGVGSGDFSNMSSSLTRIADNDGLHIDDFIAWFNIHPKKKGASFNGQIICWDDRVNY